MTTMPASLKTQLEQAMFLILGSRMFPRAAHNMRLRSFTLLEKK
jgi:hypothetical protein